jgi:hypothetical protein
MLPSKVREYLAAYFTKTLEEAKLNYLADPMYHLVDAIQEFRDVEGIAPGLVVKMYDKAFLKYNRKHPKCWSNERQEAFRSRRS